MCVANTVYTYDAPYPACSAVVLVVCVANTVYMYDAPPPYPGIDPSLQSPVYPAAGAGAQVNGAHYPANAAAADGGPQSAAAGISLTVHYTTQLMLLLLTARSLQPQVYHSLCITLPS